MAQKEINVIVYKPTTVEGKLSLSQRIAQIHADTAARYISKQNWPSAQKQAMIASIRDSAR